MDLKEAVESVIKITGDPYTIVLFFPDGSGRVADCATRPYDKIAVFAFGEISEFIEWIEKGLTKK